MRKGKPEFTETDDGPDNEPADLSPAPDETDFLAYQDKRRSERKPLRPCDHAYNRHVSKLFDTIIPGLPIDADAPQRHIPLTPFAQIIEQTLKRLNLNASPFLDTLAANWADILPPAIARHTRPGKWDRGILYIHVATHTQLFELRRTALPTIKQALTAFAPDTPIRSIHLMVGTISGKSS